MLIYSFGYIILLTLNKTIPGKPHANPHTTPHLPNAFKARLMDSVLIGLVMICMISYVLFLAVRTIFDREFWRPTPWLSPVDGSAVTEASVSDLLYCIAQESAYAQQHMPLLCDLCNVSFPPQSDFPGFPSRPGLCSAPLSVASPPQPCPALNSLPKDS